MSWWALLFAAATLLCALLSFVDVIRLAREYDTWSRRLTGSKIDYQFHVIRRGTYWRRLLVTWLVGAFFLYLSLRANGHVPS